MSDRKEVKRGANPPRSECVFVGAWVPTPLAEALDLAVARTDSDRSKILREALREKISRTTQEAA